ncbi:MAG: hypothetical protein JWN52_7203, partial [Actinomycetia bacterium]|nr:hypothetical protein [Actinomycetes bacterium]
LSTGSLRRYDIVYTSTGVHIKTYDSDDTLISDTVQNDVDGTPGYAGVQLIQGPFGQPNTTVGGSFAWCALAASSASTGGANAASQTCGRITSVIVNPNRSDLTGVVIGHITVHNIIQGAFVLSDQVQAFVGETAGDRIQRLCGEEGIQFTAIGASDAVPANATLANGHLPANELRWQLLDTAAMGPQTAAKLTDLLKECADTDLGILFEPRDALGLGYRTRTSMYNQTVRLAMTYSNEEIGDALSPVDDDQSTRNDIVVSRPKGSTARAVLQTGALSVQPPPDGVGRYDDSPPANVQADTDLPDQAGWRLHLGTVDEPRYPQITLNLENPAFTASQTLTNGAFMLEAGDRITVDMPSTWPLPDQISQIAQGFTETIGVSEHTIAVNCSPESPYRIGIADDSVLGRCDTAGSTLAVDVDATTTTLSVATTSGPLWTTSGAEFPFDVSLGGEVVTVTNITGAASPQAFTVSRSVNGVVKAQTAGTDIRLTHPMILGL